MNDLYIGTFSEEIAYILSQILIKKLLNFLNRGKKYVELFDYNRRRNLSMYIVRDSHSANVEMKQMKVLNWLQSCIKY
jgi:hypothetical protein